MSNFHIQKQIRVLYSSAILSNLSITGAWVVLLSQRGFSLWQIGIAETVFHITSLIFEIPSGALADVYGRKKMLLCSSISAAIASIVMVFSTDLPMVCLSIAIHALSYNFASGSGDALAYDSLKLVGEEKRYEKYASDQSVIYRITSGISTLCAGLALFMGYQLAYLLSAVSHMVAFAVTLLLVEVRPAETEETETEEAQNANEDQTETDNIEQINEEQKEDERIQPMQSGAKQNRKTKIAVGELIMKPIRYFAESFRFLAEHTKATKLMFLNSFVGAVDILLLFFLQSNLKTAGLSDWLLGPALFLMEMGGVIGSKLILKAERSKYVKVFAICCMGVICGVLLEHTRIAWIMVLGGFLSSMADDAIQIRTDRKLQDMFPSEQRATLISISSFTFSVIMIMLSPLAGWFFERW